MKRNTKQTLKEKISKKVKVECLDADECLKTFDHSIDHLLTFFTPPIEDKTCPLPKNDFKTKSIRNMTLADIAKDTFKFQLGAMTNIGDFSHGDQCLKVLQVRRSYTGYLVGKVQWKQRINGEVPLCREFPTSVLAHYAPQQLIKYYKSKMHVQNHE